MKKIINKICNSIKERRRLKQIESLRKKRYELRCEFRKIPQWDIASICWPDQKKEERRVANQIININKELQKLGFIEEEIDKFHGINWDSNTGEMIND